MNSNFLFNEKSFLADCASPPPIDLSGQYQQTLRSICTLFFSYVIYKSMLDIQSRVSCVTIPSLKVGYIGVYREKTVRNTDLNLYIGNKGIIPVYAVKSFLFRLKPSLSLQLLKAKSRNKAI